MAEKPKKRIRTAAKAKTKDQFTGFIGFIRKQGVVGLAIGFIIGTQAKVVVDQMSASFINPLLGLFIGGGDNLTAQKFSLTLGDNTATFMWGQFAFVLINFLITAAIIYFTFRWLRLDKLDKKD